MAGWAWWNDGRRSPYILHPSSFILHPSSFILHPSSFILQVDPIYLIIIAAVIIALPFVLRRLLSGKLNEARKALEARAATLAGRASAPPAGAARRPAPVERAPTTTAPMKAAPVEVKVKGLIEQGRKIEAIKLVRETGNPSLEAAKDSVDAIEQHGRPTLGEMGMMSTIRLTQELSRQVRQLIARGEKIEAIRLVRDQTGLDLKEAKELVERLG